MKNRFSKITGVLFMSAIFLVMPNFAFAATADSSANAKTQAILTWLTNLPNSSSDKLISGQHSGINYNTDTVFSTINANTGKYPGLAGWDFMYANNSTTYTLAKNWSDANGLVTIVNHWKNPATDSSYSSGSPGGPGSAWDTSGVDMVQLITNGTVLNTKLKGYLDAVATGLQTMQTNNVTVLYRPLHEMNGSWFWWGAKDTTQYKNLWIYIFNYLTTTKGLHNILWVYSINANSGNATAYYPGSQYVDIVGVDIYGNPTFTDSGDYNSLETLNKPFAITEFGGCSPSGCTADGHAGGVSLTGLPASIQTYAPKTVYWMNWASLGGQDFGLDKTNAGTSTIFANSLVLTRDEMPSMGVVEDAMPPAAPTGLSVI